MRRELRLLAIALLGVEVDERGPRTERLRVRTYRFLEQRLDLAGVAAKRLHETGVAQQRLFVLRLLLEDSFIALARRVRLLVKAIELPEVADRWKIIRLDLQRALEVCARGGEIALAQVDDSFQVVYQRIGGLFLLEPVDRSQRLVELFLANEVRDERQVGRGHVRIQRGSGLEIANRSLGVAFREPHLA